jgi:hypothetical protein
MGDKFPEAEVQATDLSPIQPDSVPPNVYFFVDDASENDWDLSVRHFDYIHTRVLLGCFTDFGDIIRKSFYYLRAGGYMESQEILSAPSCDDNTIAEDWPFNEWHEYGDQAATRAGRPIKIARRLKEWYEQAGFVDVQENIFKIPINPRPREKHMRPLGAMWEENLLSGLSGFGMAHYRRNLFWTKDQIEVCLQPFWPKIADCRIR